MDSDAAEAGGLRSVGQQLAEELNISKLVVIFGAAKSFSSSSCQIKTVSWRPERWLDMIDDEADFGNITDAPAEVQTAAKFRPKARAKPRKPSVPSKSLVPNPTVVTTDEDGLSQEHATDQEMTSSTSLGNETIGDAASRGGILDTPTDDVLIVSAVDRVSQNEDHNDDMSEVAAHQENLVVSDTKASSIRSSGKKIDDLADFEGLFDTPVEEEKIAKFKPKIQVKLSKRASKSRKSDQKAVVSTVDGVSQSKEDGNNQTGFNDFQVQAPRHQERVQTSDSQVSVGTDCSTVDNLADHDSILEEPIKEETAAKFQPKSQRKPGTASSGVVGTSENSAAANLDIGVCALDVSSQDTKFDSHGDSHGEGHSDLRKKPSDQEAITVRDTWPPQDMDASVDLDSQDELINLHTDDTQPTFVEPSAEATAKFQPNVGRKKGKGKSVTFVLPDASEGVAPTDTNSEMSLPNENLINLPQQTAQKHCLTEEQHSNDWEYTDRESQYHEGEPSDHAVEPKLDAGKLGLSLKLRSRKKSQKVGMSDDDFDEDHIEPSAGKQDNDNGGEYAVGGKQRVRRKSREKDINKEPLRGSKRTSKSSTIEESQQQNLQQNKSEVPSRGRKRALKDTLIEQPAKKLTHRIRQKRTREVKTLLEKPDHEIDRMKLSVMHLRLLQEARERIKSKTIPSGPSSSNQSSQFGDTDNFDPFGENYDNDRTENHGLENATKLNYHSYMNKQTRAKWSKSDTDLFYQGLQQFGSDFAMIQQLFPDKTRDQVRQKFKTEEKKLPMQVHDAILHRSRDNVYLKQVIKQLNIDDLQRDITDTHNKQEGASNEGDPGNENVLDDFINGEEENGSNWADAEEGTHRSEVNEGEHVSATADDDLDVFDWY